MLSRLVLGTGNRKKGQELARLLARAGLEIRTLADYPQAIEVVEDGDTFAANAALKATAAGPAPGRMGPGRRQRADGRCLGWSAGRAFRPLQRSRGDRRRQQSEAAGGLARRAVGAARRQFVCHICLADPAARSAAKVPPPAAAGSCSRSAAAAVSATIRSSRSWSTIAVSAP